MTTDEWGSVKVNKRLAPLGYEVDPLFRTDNTVWCRRARKTYKCRGAYIGGINRVTCAKPIEPGTDYIEYCGEVGNFQSGYRYHLECAVTQGLIRPLEEPAEAKEGEQ